MSFTRMRYHFVTATQARRPWLTERVQTFLRHVMVEKADERGCKIIQAGGVEDHEHIVAAVLPSIAPADFIGKLKSESSRRIGREFPSLADFAWQEGYGSFTLWPRRMDNIIDYVKHQRRHHRRGTLRSRLERVSSPNEKDDA